MLTSRWERFSTAELDVLYHILEQSVTWSNIKSGMMSEIQVELLKRRQSLFSGVSNSNFR